MLVDVGNNNPVGLLSSPSDEPNLPPAMAGGLGFSTSAFTVSNGGKKTTLPMQSSSTSDYFVVNAPSQEAIGSGPLGSQQNGSWTVEHSQQINNGQYFASFDENRYTYNGGNGNGLNGSNVFLSTPLSPFKAPMVQFAAGAGSGGSSSRGGMYTVVGASEFSSCSNNTSISPLVSDTSTSPGVSSSRHMMSINVSNGGSGGGGGVMRVNNSTELSQWSPHGTPTLQTSSPLFFATFDGLVRLKMHPLRFKMLPSPVPYDMLFTDNLSDPSPKRLAHYQGIMLRWYQHILVAQENVRARIRQRCPPPPECVLGQLVPPDPNELQNWSGQCCRWWDETSRKRTRRGHRGGKTSVGGGNARLPSQQQQYQAQHQRVSGEVHAFADGNEVATGAYSLPYGAHNSHGVHQDEDIEKSLHRWVEGILDDE